VSFKKLLEPLGIQVLLRISGDKLNLDAFKNGTPAVIVGTHALLHEKNLPDNIALVVVDEQHRFGVAQREKLLQLDNLLSDTNVSRIPHYLSMTATPIPRTLTNVLYGDMEVSFIKSMPKDRLPIKSYFVPDNKRESCFKWVKQHIVDSNFVEQAFVVFPLIDESEKVEAKAAKTEFEVLQNGVFKGLKVGLIHGQLKQDEKDTVLEQFRNKEFNVLVATSVIEVGIDIPDASIMIIEDAQRFGLAQLHQFRGRVGRGSLQSYCYVLAGEGQKSNVKSQADIETDVTSQIHREGESLENEAAIERLKYFCAHPSGFDVAEYDLQSRGPGEVYGKIQSGIPNLKIANILDLEGVQKARKVARTLLQEVPESEIESIKNQLFHVRTSNV
jgi:ATP-dependent DNA helicase RecG